jgi:integrase/recombinase XerD
MATTITSAALVFHHPVFTNTERLALAGFLAGYSGLTRQAYELDLRQFASWCQQHRLRLFGARRADIEFFARDLEPAAGPGPRSPVACAWWLGFTGTRWR